MHDSRGTRLSRVSSYLLISTVVAMFDASTASLADPPRGSIMAWGRNEYGQTNPPPDGPNTGFIAIAAGVGHSLGLKADGSIVGWGKNQFGQTDVPAPNTGFIAVAGGGFHNLGLKTDGSIVAWGYNAYGQRDVPAPNTAFVAIAGGTEHSLGLKVDGSIVAWSCNPPFDYGQCDLPAPNTGFIAIAGGDTHSLYLKADGSIVAKGRNNFGQINVPAPNTGFVDVAAGGYHSLGLKADGSIVAWGDNGSGQSSVPVPNSGFVAIAAGAAHSLGLKTDGSIVAWGCGDPYNYGQCSVPAPNTGFIAVAAGLYHGLALKPYPRFVDLNATGLNNGSSWVNAFTKLQDALAAALPGDEIWVAKGTHKPTQKSCTGASDCGGGAPNSCPAGVCVWDQPRAQTFQLLNGVALYGGFEGTETQLSQRDPATNVTILSGDLLGNDAPGFIGNNENSCHVVTASDTDSTALIDGFTITSGNGNSCGGVDKNGAGIFIVSGSPTVKNCQLVANSASLDGGGVYTEIGSPVFVNCAFSGNRSDSDGGAIYNKSPNLTLINCRILGNDCVSGDGGGLAIASGGGTTVINSVIAGNNADQGGGIHVSSALTLVLRNTTVALNRASIQTGGIRNQPSTPVDLRNCIVWGNSSPDAAPIVKNIHSTGGGLTVEYTLVEGWTEGGTGNLNANPMFVDADGPDNVAGTEDDDLRLQAGSPAIDAADTTALPLDTFDLDGDGNTSERVSLDLAGNPRLRDDTSSPDVGTGGFPLVDKGAYEFQPAFVDCNLNGVADDLDILNGTSQDLNFDGVPDECVAPTGTGGTANWSDGTNWSLAGSYPDNVAGVPDLHVTLDHSLTLNVPVVIDSLLVLSGVALDVTGGNLTITGAEGQTAGITLPPKLKLSLDGTIAMANGYDVTVLGDSVAVKDGGLYHSTGATDSALTAVDIAVYAGGELSLEHSMTMTSSGTVLLDGSESDPVCPPPVVAGNVAGITLPPKLRLRDIVNAYAAGSVSMVGAVDLIVDSTVPVLLGGDFDNRSTAAHCFNWSTGRLLLDGASPQVFEVAGLNLGQSTAGFLTDADTLYDSNQHTNYSMGTVEVASMAHVSFANRFANTAAVGCAEALYVHNLTFQSGATVTIDNCKVYYETLTPNGVTSTLIGCGELLSTTRPETPNGDPSGIKKNRGLALSVPPSNTAGPGALTALRVALVELQNPVPPNLPQNPPPDFSTYEFASSCTDPAGCVRWIGEPKVFLESQDSPGSGNFKAARLQCTPLYRDWTTAGIFYVVGAEIIPSSKYDVQQFAQTCAERELSCTALSAPLRINTARSGDVEQPFNPPDTSTQPDVTDIAQLVNKFKNVVGAPSKPLAQLQPNLPELNADINVLDIVAVVDAVKQKAYAFSGPCPCPSTVTCGSTGCSTATPCVTAFGAGATCVKTCSGGDNAGDPCINDTHGHCPGGTCGAGFCRDRCGRCSP